MGENKITKGMNGAILIMTTIFVGTLIITIIPTNINDFNKNNQNSSLADDFNDLEMKQITDIQENINNEEINLPQTASADSWWNEEFDARKELTISETGVGDRTDEVVNVVASFDLNKCHENSTRIIYFDGITQTEIPSQLSNTTYWTSTDYIKSTTIFFQISINKNEIKTCYLYYSSTPMESKTADYITQNGMSFEYINGRAKVDTNSLYYELANETGFDVLKLSSEKTTGINYHTSSSMSPLPTISNGSDMQTYSVSSYGYFYHWLLVGPFLEGTTTFSSYPTINGFHVNPTLLYGEGDNAIKNTPAISGSDETKKWTAYHDTDSAIYLEYIYGTDDYCAAYALCYVYFPQDEADVYIKVGSSDGIRVIYDGRVGDVKADFKTHSVRALQTDDDVWKIGETVTKGWHRFFVMIDVYDDSHSWQFKFRLSKSSSSYSAISGLQIMLNPPKTNIKNITLTEHGPIYTTMKVDWEKSGDMYTSENLTFYHNLPMYKSTRSFFWENNHNPTVGNTWSVLNSYFQSIAVTKVDNLIVDGQSKSIGVNNTNANQYMAVHDSSGDNYYIAQGVFITNLTKNTPSMVFNSLDFTYKYENNIPSIIPGNNTNLDNLGSHTYTIDPQYSVNIEFWELTKRYIGIGTLNSSEELNLINIIIRNPLVCQIGSPEKVFYNIEIQLEDIDGNPAPNLDITIFNTTGNDFEIIYPYYETGKSDITNDFEIIYPYYETGKSDITNSSSKFNIDSIIAIFK